MLLALIIFYVVTLVYAAITERFRHYAMLIGLQGWLLLGVALLRLHGIDWLELSFVLVETLVFKAVVMPAMLFAIIRRTGIFFGVALYALLSGMLLIVSHKRIFSHLVGFLVIENGVFLFSMAIGVEMPFLINIAILLDILMSVLMLGLFVGKIGSRLHDLNADTLTTIKD